ncbi:glycosyltransferase involved in cell wall biosynthesis [Mycetocola sp. CAN_C7]|uniref:glycosyltransferase family 4 protein n=1 Tax=Mycetocola sp. CAN_C7 TaxID=2787724 RepID=UPI0018CA85C2
MSSNHPKRDIVFFLPAINPYWAKRLAALNESSDISFECWFLARRGPGREWVVPDSDLRFVHHFLPSNPVSRLKQLLRLYVRARPTYILTFHFMPSLWPSMIQRLLPGKKLIFYAEKTWDSWVKRTPAKEFAKRVIFRQANVILTPGADAEEYLLPYSGSKTVFGRLPHVVDVDYLSRARVARPHRQTPIHVLYLGRLIAEKGIHHLLNALDLLTQEGAPITVSFVGSGNLYDEIKVWSESSPLDVRLEQFVQADSLNRFLAEADLLVFPTLGDPYGLVVDEALAAGIPVISSDAAGEIGERLGTDTAHPRGLIYPSGDTAALASQIALLCQDDQILGEMGRSAASYADQNSTVNKWVESIERAIRPRGRKIGIDG